jgi:hypothetical protein
VATSGRKVLNVLQCYVVLMFPTLLCYVFILSVLESIQNNVSELISKTHCMDDSCSTFIMNLNILGDSLARVPKLLSIKNYVIEIMT